jgi:hypothetical protein
MNYQPIDITGLDKAEILVALWNAAPSPIDALYLDKDFKPQMEIDWARKLIAETPDLYFDYIGARCLKIDLSGDTLDARRYDRDAGQGAALRALTPLLGADRIAGQFRQNPSGRNLVDAIAAKLMSGSHDRHETYVPDNNWTAEDEHRFED